MSINDRIGNRRSSVDILSTSKHHNPSLRANNGVIRRKSVDSEAFLDDTPRISREDFESTSTKDCEGEMFHQRKPARRTNSFGKSCDLGGLYQDRGACWDFSRQPKVAESPRSPPPLPNRGSGARLTFVDDLDSAYYSSSSSGGDSIVSSLPEEPAPDYEVTYEELDAIRPDIFHRHPPPPKVPPPTPPLASHPMRITQVQSAAATLHPPNKRPINRASGHTHVHPSEDRHLYYSIRDMALAASENGQNKSSAASQCQPHVHVHLCQGDCQSPTGFQSGKPHIHHNNNNMATPPRALTQPGWQESVSSPHSQFTALNHGHAIGQTHQGHPGNGHGAYPGQTQDAGLFPKINNSGRAKSLSDLLAEDEAILNHANAFGVQPPTVSHSVSQPTGPKVINIDHVPDMTQFGVGASGVLPPPPNFPAPPPPITQNISVSVEEDFLISDTPSPPPPPPPPEIDPQSPTENFGGSGGIYESITGLSKEPAKPKDPEVPAPPPAPPVPPPPPPPPLPPSNSSTLKKTHKSVVIKDNETGESDDSNNKNSLQEKNRQARLSFSAEEIGNALKGLKRRGTKEQKDAEPSSPKTPETAPKPAPSFNKHRQREVDDTPKHTTSTVNEHLPETGKTEANSFDTALNLKTAPSFTRQQRSEAVPNSTAKPFGHSLKSVENSAFNNPKQDIIKTDVQALKNALRATPSFNVSPVPSNIESEKRPQRSVSTSRLQSRQRIPSNEENKIITGPKTLRKTRVGSSTEEDPIRDSTGPVSGSAEIPFLGVKSLRSARTSTPNGSDENQQRNNITKNHLHNANSSELNSFNVHKMSSEEPVISPSAVAAQQGRGRSVNRGRGDKQEPAHLDLISALKAAQEKVNPVREEEIPTQKPNEALNVVANQTVTPVKPVATPPPPKAPEPPVLNENQKRIQEKIAQMRIINQALVTSAQRGDNSVQEGDENRPKLSTGDIVSAQQNVTQRDGKFQKSYTGTNQALAIHSKITSGLVRTDQNNTNQNVPPVLPKSAGKIVLPNSPLLSALYLTSVIKQKQTAAETNTSSTTTTAASSTAKVPTMPATSKSPQMATSSKSPPVVTPKATATSKVTIPKSKPGTINIDDIILSSKNRLDFENVLAKEEKSTMEDIDVSQIPGYIQIPPSTPAWKKQVMEKKNAEILKKYQGQFEEILKEKQAAEERKKQEEEERKKEEEQWKGIPEWKRKIMRDKKDAAKDSKPAAKKAPAGKQPPSTAAKNPPPGKKQAPPPAGKQPLPAGKQPAPASQQKAAPKQANPSPASQPAAPAGLKKLDVKKAQALPPDKAPVNQATIPMKISTAKITFKQRPSGQPDPAVAAPVKRSIKVLKRSKA